MIDLSYIANFFGFLALITYILSLTPTIARIVFPKKRLNKAIILLTKYRREVGLSAFIFGLIHGTLMVYIRELNLFEPHTFLRYFQGIAMMTIFTLLASTSNDWSVRHLKHNWKRLHSLTYLVMLLLPWHILDKMYGHWDAFTGISLALITSTILLFLKRKQIQFSQKKPPHLPNKLNI